MSELTSIKDDIREIKKAILHGNIGEEPVNEGETCKYLGISRQTMRQYVCEGKMEGTYVINKLGKRMFYKSKLIIK